MSNARSLVHLVLLVLAAASFVAPVGAQSKKAGSCVAAKRVVPLVRASEVHDPLAVGRVFVGTWFEDTWCRAEVVERNRAAGTAAIRITGARQARFRAELEVSKNGSSFTITSIRQVAPAPGERMAVIDFKSGSGRVGAKQLRMTWRARIDKPDWKGSWNTTVKAAPI